MQTTISGEVGHYMRMLLLVAIFYRGRKGTTTSAKFDRLFLSFFLCSVFCEASTLTNYAERCTYLSSLREIIKHCSSHLFKLELNF